MIPSQNKALIFQNSSFSTNRTTKKLRILHFNDVYNIEGLKEEPIGGAARFKTALDYYNKDKNCLIAFSGDALSPSTLSLFSKGNQMIDCLNKLNIHAAGIGNHEFDMGLDALSKMISKSNFPWILSNVFDADSHQPLVKAETKVIVDINNIKIGIICLAEKDWIKSLSSVSFEDLIFESFIQTSRKLANEFRNQNNVDVVIALTHMRWPNDEKLARKVPEIDLFLGGHDHDYEVKNVFNRWIIKSGADFKEFSVIDIEVTSDKKFILNRIRKITVDSNIPENEEIKSIVNAYLDEADKKLDEELGIINSALDGRYDIVRTSETNLGNFLCDIILSSVHADCSILNGGSLRSDRIHPAGPFTRRDLRSILPFDSELVVVSVTGKQLHQILENGVAKYENIGGRFPQISGLFFTYDIRKQSGERVDPRLIKVQDEYLDYNKNYKLATNTFLKNVDVVLKECPVLISSENIPFLYTLVENYFKTINNIKSKKVNQQTLHRSQIIPRVIISALMTKLSQEPEFRANEVIKKEKNRLTFRFVAMFVLKTLKQRKVLLYKDRKMIKQSEKFKKSLQEFEQKSLDLSPEIENRSIQIKTDQDLELLLNKRKLYDENLNQ